MSIKNYLTALQIWHLCQTWLRVLAFELSLGVPLSTAACLTAGKPLHCKSKNGTYSCHSLRWEPAVSWYDGGLLQASTPGSMWAKLRGHDLCMLQLMRVYITDTYLSVDDTMQATQASCRTESEHFSAMVHKFTAEFKVMLFISCCWSLARTLATCSTTQ